LGHLRYRSPAGWGAEPRRAGEPVRGGPSSAWPNSSDDTAISSGRRSGVSAGT